MDTGENVLVKEETEGRGGEGRGGEGRGGADNVWQEARLEVAGRGFGDSYEDTSGKSRQPSIRSFCFLG